MRFKIARKDYDFLKKIEKLLTFEHASQIDIQEFTVYLTFESYSNYDDFMDDLTFAIVHFGMDNQDTVNAIGIVMYRVYDGILEQYKEYIKHKE